MSNKCSRLRFVSVLIGSCLASAVLTVNANDDNECVRAVDAEIDDELLTRDEKIEIMNQRFFDELARFEECINKQNATGGGSANAAAGGSGGSGGQGAVSGSQTFSAATQAAPASGIQGTEMPDQEPTTPTTTDQNMLSMANGKMAEELETADNDAVLLEQIRQAAIAEEDPALKEKLWQEYNRRASGKGGSSKLPESSQTSTSSTSIAEQAAVTTSDESTLTTSSDADDGLLEQIRQAAIAEQDPTMKEQLWQEYNRRAAGQGGSTKRSESSQSSASSSSTVEQASVTVPNEPTLTTTSDADDGLLEQIRQAAIAEQDPTMKEQLWQEYNRRKASQGGSSKRPESSSPSTTSSATQTQANQQNVTESVAMTGENNSLLEQIRQAAMAEQDPTMKEQLWQEYNRRKSGQGGQTQSE